jgi:hypothetical protein
VPLDAVDWAGSVLRSQIRSEVEKELPEFKAAVDWWKKTESCFAGGLFSL